jgi:superfamily II DNA/RNA helicase
MMTQFQKEFWTRFTIPLVRLDSLAIQRIRTRIPGNHNPFHYYDRSIISIDTLKQDREYRSYLEQAYWDIILIDEAHNVARRQGASQRAKLAERLSSRSDTLILLSATPHDGRPESFASLMNMLDPTAIANESSYTKEDISDLYVRRFKKDVLKDLKKHVPERNVEAVEAKASFLEEQAFDVLNDLKLKSVDSRKKAGQLFKTTLLKAMLSSPYACLETVHNRLKRLASQAGSKEVQQDIEELEGLEAVLKRINVADFSKYQELLKLIREKFGWRGREAKDRLVIFTGRIETLKFLKRQLADDLGLKDEAISVLDGGISDVDQNQIVEAFGQESAKVRILLATEVASEGLNLHYLSHKLIHFDIPWSLMTLQQRNGRIDRYGQTRQPEIRYLLTRSGLERMDEVKRIIKVLLDKDEQAIKNIGDPSVFMGVFETEAEEEVTARAIEDGTSAESFSQQLDENAKSGGAFNIFDWFDNPDTFEETAEESNYGGKIESGTLMSLFPSTYSFTTAALRALEIPPENLNINDADRFVELKLPAELARRYERLPSEIRPKEKELTFLTDRASEIMRAMEEARRARRMESSWPKKEYLWDLHPLVEWLTDRCAFRFGRHQAPVLLLRDGFEAQESTFVLLGSFPNRRGTPVLNRWLSAVFQGDRFCRMEPFSDTLERTGLGKRSIPNPGAAALPLGALSLLREEAVEKARAYLQAERLGFERELAPKLTNYVKRLERLRGEHFEQLELRFEGDSRPDTIKQQRRKKEQHRIEKIFQDYRNWVEQSMTTESEPYIKLVAVLRRED